MKVIRIICKGRPPEKWGDKHYLECTHSLNSPSKIHYLMYCNVLKPMKGSRVKITVFGTRYVSLGGERVRYVDSEQVVGSNGWSKSTSDLKMAV